VNLLDRKTLEVGLKLEAARRLPPFDTKGCSLNWDKANKEYQNWLHKHGYVLILQSMEKL
jgi:hypothetical protein